jgi:hypothetical protein
VTGANAPDINDFIEYLCSRARLVQVYFLWRPIAERSGIRTMSPGELLGVIGAQK